MRSLQDEIKQAQRDLFCPICSRTFALKDIRIRTFLSNSAVELSVICNRGHIPVILLLPIVLKEVAKAGHISPTELRKAYKKIESLERSLTEFH